MTHAEPARAARQPGRDREVARYRRVLMERDRAAELTELLARTWPPRSLMELDGWRLRTGRGLPAHAASAWPRAEGERVALRARLDGTHRYYTQAGLTPSVLISPAARPNGTEAALRRDGWAARYAAELRTGRLESLQALSAASGVRVRVEERLRDGWLDAWAALTGRTRSERDGAATSLERCDAVTAYVTAWLGQDLAGVARAVVDGGWAGLPDMALAGDAEVAASMAARIAGWAADHHVEQVWWLVADPGGRAAEATDVGGRAAVDATRRAQLAPALRLHLRVAGPGGPAGGSEGSAP